MLVGNRTRATTSRLPRAFPNVQPVTSERNDQMRVLRFTDDGSSAIQAHHFKTPVMMPGAVGAGLCTDGRERTNTEFHDARFRIRDDVSSALRARLYSLRPKRRCVRNGQNVNTALLECHLLCLWCLSINLLSILVSFIAVDFAVVHGAYLAEEEG